MDLITQFEDNKKRKIEVYQLDMSSFSLLKNFYQNEIDKLQDKADFYPYKDSEIENILKGEGVFAGAFHNSQLIAVAAVDFDSGYQKEIKKVNCKYPNFPQETVLLEFSGLFVESQYRKAKIAENLVDILVDYVNIEEARLFATIQISNVGSLKTFFSYGFSLYGCYKMDDTFTFVYLIHQGKSEKYNLEKVARNNLEQKLLEGYVFVDFKCDHFLGYKKKN